MAHSFLTAAVLAGATATLLAAAPGPQNASPSTAKSDPNKEPITMKGCIVPDATAARQYMFTDSIDGTKYRLSGRDVSKFMGQPLQIVGVVDTRRLRVVGGLTPSPN